ncbi:hypothetical protein PHMEG_00012256 [Phytophthora megakarya]|uniref:Uncharacterized protein n=1 Tax=Phytophthora megakarya TaxID=4795 RepID=A0A225W963_9STRA|nr:hypothetical protein PHMEG_00012256 [Phytophthora megakarya]
MSASLQTPASSPVSVSTSVSTPVADPPSALTSVSGPASALVSTATPTPPNGTTEKNFSVDKYFELQEIKRAGAAKIASPKIAFDGSSVLSTDGGIPVDYEECELEDEGTSSSQSCDAKPAAGTRRAREDDSEASSSKRPRSVSDAVPSALEAPSIASDPPAITLVPPVVSSEQRDAPRTDDSVRDPWMPSESVISARLQLLHARVEAIENVQAAQIDEPKQQLNVTEAAQTTSNIRIEMSEQVRLLQEKVKKLDEKLKSHRLSSSASHHG